MQPLTRLHVYFYYIYSVCVNTETSCKLHSNCLYSYYKLIAFFSFVIVFDRLLKMQNLFYINKSDSTFLNKLPVKAKTT